MLPNDTKKALGGCQGDAKHCREEDIVEESLRGWHGDGVSLFEQLTGDSRRTEEEREELAKQKSKNDIPGWGEERGGRGGGRGEGGGGEVGGREGEGEEGGEEGGGGGGGGRRIEGS